MYQKVVILGRLVDDAVEFQYGQDGKGARLRIAADSGKDQTTYFDSVAFGKNAENILKFFKKGRPIMVEGRMENNDREREVNGVKVMNYGMNFVIERWAFTGDSNQNAGGQQQQQSNQQQYQQNNQQQQQQPNQQQQQQPASNDGFTGFGSEDDFPF